MKFIKGARTWRSILGTQTFFWPLTHPPTHPPPGYSINQPLSKGLVRMPPAITRADTDAFDHVTSHHVPLTHGPCPWAVKRPRRPSRVPQVTDPCSLCVKFPDKLLKQFTACLGI